MLATILLGMALIGAVRPDAPGLARWIDAFLEERSVFYDAEVLGGYEGPWTFRMEEPLPR